MIHQTNSLHARVEEGKIREEKLKGKIAELEAKNKQLTKQLFGRKSEKGKAKSEGTSDDHLDKEEEPKRKRGQQPGNPAPKRREQPNIPTIEEHVDFEKEDQCCQTCGLDWLPFFQNEESQVHEVEIKAHTRKIIRHCYKQGCQCNDL